MPSMQPWVPVLPSAGWSMAGTCCPCCWGQHSTRTTSSWCITVRISCTQSVGTNGTVSTLGDQVTSWLLFPWLCFTTGPFLAFWAVFSPRHSNTLPDASSHLPYHHIIIVYGVFIWLSCPQVLRSASGPQSPYLAYISFHLSQPP